MPALADLAVEAMAWLGAYAANVVSSPQQLIAHAAALVGVVLAACAALMRTMVPLRWMAVGSNLGLLVFGLLKPSPVTGIVAGLLLPINIYRALEIMRLSRRVEKAAKGTDMATIWLRPYMKPRRLRAGTVLFRKGDRANRLYLLTEGELEVVEHGQRIEPGRVFGEIALFSPDHLRTGTVQGADGQPRAVDPRKHGAAAVLPEPHLRLPPGGAAGLAPVHRRGPQRAEAGPGAGSHRLGHTAAARPAAPLTGRCRHQQRHPTSGSPQGAAGLRPGTVPATP